MKKLILISIAVLTIVGIVYAQSDYIMSLFVRQRLVMQPDATTSTQSAEIYFEAGTADQGTYIYESTDGNLSLVTETSVIIPAGFLTGNASIRGTGTFTAAEQVDTVVIAGLLSTDIVVTSFRYVGGLDAQDTHLQAEVKDGSFIVHRNGSGESGAKWDYIIIR